MAILISKPSKNGWLLTVESPLPNKHYQENSVTFHYDRGPLTTVSIILEREIANAVDTYSDARKTIKKFADRQLTLIEDCLKHQKEYICNFDDLHTEFLRNKWIEK